MLAAPLLLWAQTAAANIATTPEGAGQHGVVAEVATKPESALPRNDIVVTAGAPVTLYVSPFSGVSSFGIEGAVHGRFQQSFLWGAGARLGFAPALPEVFGRVLLAPLLGAWEPAAGLEVGVTARAHFEDGAEQFGDVREAARRDVVPVYLALQTMPLRFQLGERYRLSVLEVQIGTHFFALRAPRAPSDRNRLRGVCAMSARAALLAVVVVVVACSPAAPDEAGFAEAAAIGREVVAEEVMPWVQRLADGHATDVHVSCQDNPPEPDYPACDLSRDAAVRLAQEAFRSLGLETATVVLGDEPYAAINVIGERQGAARPSEVVLLGAHLDAFFQGADDNSSGVAALLEAARALLRHRFARTLRFVAFDLEELRSAGATRYVEAGLADGVVAAFILDAVGFASSVPGSQESPTGVPVGDVGDFLLAVGNEDSAELVQRMMALAKAHDLVKMRGVLAPGSGAFPVTGVLMRSDHGPFWLRGLPALLLTDTANFRNPHYHGASDTPDTLDPDFLVRVTRAVTASVALVAELEP